MTWMLLILIRLELGVSQGAASLAAYALGLDKDSEEVIEFHRQELLEIYEGVVWMKRHPEGIDKVLDQLNDMEIKWGIITNKPRRFAESIVDNKLNTYKTPFLICPDDVGVRKPEPDGLLHAFKNF